MSNPFDELTVIGQAADRISELIQTGDMSTPVPGLGRWKVRDVVAHLGGVHEWAARIVETKSMDGPGATKSKLGGGELREWFAAGAGALVGSLGASDRREPCPNFNPGSIKDVSWWLRRQAHETTVHRWDIERAFDATTPIDPAIAAMESTSFSMCSSAPAESKH